MSGGALVNDVLSRERPDYATLFGSSGLCDCEQCRSIHSPAAYLVDLLQFIGPELPGVSPLDALIGHPAKSWPDGRPVEARRPDIAQLKLSCENTETPIPYVDLANEVMESFIAFGQTLPLAVDGAGAIAAPPVTVPNESSPGATAADLGAGPEHVQPLAYDLLATACFPFTLPFSQPLSSLRLTLKAMGTSREALMHAFGRTSAPGGEASAAIEPFAMPEREFEILTGERFDGTAAAGLPTPAQCWGADEPAPAVPERKWVSGSLPPGAVPQLLLDSWTFAPSAPPPPSGANGHVSAPAAGLHQHFFDGVPAAGRMSVGADDIIYAEILIDAANLPEMVMLQLAEPAKASDVNGSWSRRVYWGENKVGWGVEGTESSRYMGPLPKAGAWTRLEIPASHVGETVYGLTGMAFTLFGGAATWGEAGVRSATWAEKVGRVPDMLGRAGIAHVELIELLRCRFVNPALPIGPKLAFFDRVPISFSALGRLVDTGFASPDPKTLDALAEAGMTLDELQDWAEEEFGDLAGLLVLDSPDSSCDLAVTRLIRLDGKPAGEDDLERLHRFVRLWRRSGWSITDLDRALTAFQANAVTPEALRHLGGIERLRRTLDLPVQKLLAFFGKIPSDGKASLYESLFLNKAVRGIDPGFQPVEGALLADPALRIADHAPALLAALRLRESDLNLILGHLSWTSAGIPKALSDPQAPLTLATATILYRYSALARALHVSVTDLIRLEILWGASPFPALASDNQEFEPADMDPERMITFVELAGRVGDSGFSPAILSYLFGGDAAAAAAAGPAEASVDRAFTAIRLGLARIAEENSPGAATSAEMLKERLGLVFEPDIVQRLIGLVDGTAVWRAPLQDLPAGVAVEQDPPGQVAPGKAGYSAETHQLFFVGWPTDVAISALAAASPDLEFQKAVKALHDQPRSFLESTLGDLLQWAAPADALAKSVLEAPLLGAGGKVDSGLLDARVQVFELALLPYLQGALSRSLIRQSLADTLGLEPPAASILLEGEAGKSILGSDEDPTRPALDDFLSLSGDGLAASYFPDGTLAGAPDRTTIDRLIAFSFNPQVKFGARWTGQIAAEQAQLYRFQLKASGGARLKIAGDTAERWSSEGPVELSIERKMEAGESVPIEIDYFNDPPAPGAEVFPALLELRWSGPSTPLGPVPAHQLYSTAKRAQGSAARNSFARLYKAALIVKGFALGADEIAVLMGPDRSLALRPGGFPVDPKAKADTALFKAWTKLEDYRKLRDLARDPASLVEVLKATDADDVRALLGEAAGLDPSLLTELAGPGGLALDDPAHDDPAKLRGLVEAARLVVKLGAPAKDVLAWAQPAPSIADARSAAEQAHRACQARYDPSDWPAVGREIADPLREAQRSALVAYLLPRLGYSDPGQLFEHFLIDVEMSPCMRTSRVKQAISSVQLFIQRIRMGLENGLSPALIEDERWEWMQSYRLWEANLKVFLYPENWIEPELRLDKSPFFKELETELLQTELTSEAAETALGNYLEKLHAVTSLEICGLFDQQDFAPGEKVQRILHVFGRSRTSPHAHYYRTRVTASANREYWTAWQPVPLEILADEVTPFMWNRRLYLFWLVEYEKANSETRTRYSAYGLAWSELRDGKWSPKRTTPSATAIPIGDIGIRLDVRVVADTLEFSLGKVTGGVGQSMTWGPGMTPKPGTSYSLGAKRYGTIWIRTYNGTAEVAEEDVSLTYTHGFVPSTASGLEFLPVADLDAAVPVFKRSPSMIRIFSRGTRPFSLNQDYFLQEGPRTYRVAPKSSEPAEISPYIEGQISPFVTGLGTGALIVEADPLQRLEPKLLQLGAAANPWTSAGASIATAEVKALKTTEVSVAGAGLGGGAQAEGPGVIGASKISKEAQIFDLGVIKPAEIFALSYPAEFTFETAFHPYTTEYQRRLATGGVPMLLSLKSQQASSMPGVGSFEGAYGPSGATVNRPLPSHDVDFSFSGAYSVYNWELFFHVPFLIACRLSQSQRFEEALDWFHYIFDPVAWSSDPVPKRYWKTRPLRETPAERLDAMLKALNAGDKDVIAQWEDLEDNPFEPHRVARVRLAAYQKAVVMKYYDTCIAWADQLYRSDTIEKINQATELYVQIALMLGVKPQRVPPRGKSGARAFAELRSAGIDALNQALVDFENDLPFANRATAEPASAAGRGLLGIGRSFYFCLPGNDRLRGYHDLVGGRLFNIRHCMNIEGVVRELPLFEPPIDPALLVRAAAQGVDLGSVLGDLAAPLPHYRFASVHAKALEMAGELRALGGALLSALERKDAEQLANLRAGQETELLGLVRDVKRQQLAEAQETEASLVKNREVTQARLDHYQQLKARLEEELNQIQELGLAQNNQELSQEEDLTGAELTAALPDIAAGMVGLSPHFTMTMGRGNIVAIYEANSRAKAMHAAKHTHSANLASITGNWRRRDEEWQLQKTLAARELVQIDRQIAAAAVRSALAQQELDNAFRQIEQSQEVQEHLKSKFTAEELYGWMAGEVSALYFQTYQLTYDLAKMAERCFRYERGLTSSNFISFGSWDGLRKGLLSGERLHLQLRQMERAWLTANRRDFELTKNVSLALTAPLELVRLKEEGMCEIEIPEALFDLDHPGHFMRRIKSVSISIPAVVGPYGGVNCTLTLLRDKTRIRNNVADGYAEREDGEDDRFLTSWARIQSISTSSGQNDSGLFELDYRDERYLPFEGAGAISRWRIELPSEFRQFDYSSISDCILHVKYTALAGGEQLKNASVAFLEEQLKLEEGRPQLRLVSLRREYSNEWNRLKTLADAAGNHSQAFTIDKLRFPDLFRDAAITVFEVEIFGEPERHADDAELGVVLKGPDGTALGLGDGRGIGTLIHKLASGLSVELPSVDEEGEGAEWTLEVQKADVAKSLKPIRDIMLAFHYTVAVPSHEG